MARVRGQDDGECRAAIRVVARFDVPAVQPRVLPGDRQAQAAALGTAARGVGFVEPVEYVRDRSRRQPRAVVSHRDRQVLAALPVWLQAGGHRDRRAAVAERVADEVGDDDVEAAAVQAHRQAGRRGGTHVLPSPSPQAPGDRHGYVGLVGHELGGAGVEAGDLDEVIHQPVEVEYLLADQPRGDRGVSRQARVLAEDVGHRRHRGQWGAQLMGYVTGELPGPGLHPLQLGNLVL